MARILHVHMMTNVMLLNRLKSNISPRMAFTGAHPEKMEIGSNFQEFALLATLFYIDNQNENQQIDEKNLSFCLWCS